MTAAGTPDGSTFSAASAPRAAGPTGLRELLATVGGALARRLRLLMGDDEGRAGAEALFVRYYSRFHLQTLSGAAPPDERGRWAWIYRVATSHALRAMPEGASPGRGARGAGARPWPSAVPALQALRRLDEATQAVVVLDRFDGLSEAEIAEVLDLAPALVARKRAEAGSAAPPSGADESASAGPPAAASSAHPSRLALDRDRSAPVVVAHLAACEACRAEAEDAAREAATFAAGITPAVEERLARAIRAERARLASGPRWKRIAWLGGAFVIITAMAFAVARPRDPKPDEQPFRGPGGASRAKAAGLQITARRGNDVGALQPGMFSRVGDRLHFRVRAEGPRYLEVRVRSPRGQARIFPDAGTVAVQVSPGQTLDRDYVIEGPVASPGQWLVIEGLFSEREFPLDQRPGREIEVVPVRIDVER